MKKSELTFMEGFTCNRATNDPHKVFDWDKAARIIKDFLVKFPLDHLNWK